MEPIIIVPYDSNWMTQFQEIGGLIRSALREHAIRIDHIGSTSIKGLDAKPIIDIQISVQSLEPVNIYQSLLEHIGFAYRCDNPDQSKRYFRESPGNKRIHIHVRESGSWSEQFALLFRDYMRSNEGDCRNYAALKYKLAESFRNDRHNYVNAKEPFIWEAMKRASSWSQDIGWRPAKSDI